MDVVVKGRHCEVSDRFRELVEEKLAKLEKYDHRLMRIDVALIAERNPRLSAQSHRVELTVHSKGPVIRAEAAADDKLAALDGALERLQTRLRKAADRRRVHHGSRSPVSLAQAMAGDESAGLLPADTPLVEELAGPDRADGAERDPEADVATSDAASADLTGPLEVEGDGPLVVREKTHPAVPMTLDQALYEMELVGHDFYLFIDKATDQPAVVYRRRAYDYGVLRLTS